MNLFPVLFLLAAAAGAYARYQSVQTFVHPWGTFVVNVLGCLLIGFLAVFLAKHSPHTKAIILVALLGSMTTFSSYALEIVSFIEEGLFAKAFGYLFLSNSVGLFACFLGWKIAHSMVSSH